MTSGNLIDWIQSSLTKGERIEALVIGEKGWTSKNVRCDDMIQKRKIVEVGRG